MVREVPKVQIDFGGGKKLTRTLRGNTILYLCDKSGKVVDAWPGFYTAQNFLESLSDSMSQLGRSEELKKQWHADHSTSFDKADSMITISKMMVESPMIWAMGDESRPAALPQPDTDLFSKLAGKIIDASEDPETAKHVFRLIRRETKGMTEVDRENYVLNYDSLRNLRVVRPLVHLYLSSAKKLLTPRDCKDDFYKTLLRIPINDAFLGLDVSFPGTPKIGG